MSTALQTLTTKLASRLEMGDGAELIETLKATAFKGQVSDAQMTALMVVANQYGLNPWTREIYAFPDKNNGIVPVVGVDGWARIINEHPQFDGMEFEQDEESCTCIMYRKDRSRPVKVTEWKDECHKPPTKSREGYEIKGPWQSHPRRMLRHKAMIQCARLAFGYGGIYDPDEADRIIEIDGATGEITKRPATAEDKAGAVIDQAPILPDYSEESFAKNSAKFEELIISGKKTAADIITALSTKAVLSESQKLTIQSWESGND